MSPDAGAWWGGSFEFVRPGNALGPNQIWTSLLSFSILLILAFLFVQSFLSFSVSTVAKKKKDKQHIIAYMNEMKIWSVAETCASGVVCNTVLSHSLVIR